MIIFSSLKHRFSVFAQTRVDFVDTINFFLETKTTKSCTTATDQPLVAPAQDKSRAEFASE